MPYRVSLMNISGKIEFGMDTNEGSRSRKMKTTRLVGSIESGKQANSRLKGLGSVRARRSYVKAVSVFFVLCAAATVVFSALALTEASQATVRQPVPPHTIFGYSFAADGVTPLNGAIVTVTNMRTGEWTIWNETHDGWDPTSNIYSIDLSEMPTAWADGDLINATATKDFAIGWNEGLVTGSAAYDQIDVTLDGTVIPEFPMIILPVGGMIALFAVVSLRRKSKEQ
jgi:hypothetical protein